MGIERHLFEQHEKIKKHKTKGQRQGKTALIKYSTNKSTIEYSNLLIINQNT